MRQHNMFIYGFTIFTMFFGSGNLVFPLKIGLDSGNHWFAGFLGLFTTGVILPFLGLFVIKLYRGNYEDFFGEAGGLARVILPLFTLSLLGSFGVVPRCITVAYGGIEHVFSQISLLVFSLVFCVSTFFICLNDSLMISILGKWLTPILLLFLAFLIITGVLNAPVLPEATINTTDGFLTGFFQGYETMDLFAAFFFSALIFKHIQALFDEKATNSDIIKVAVKPSLIGAGLLAIVYLGFVFLGAHFHDIVANVTPELILPTIATYLLGGKAALVISIIVILSCLTTAVALNNIYARWICSSLKLRSNMFPVVLFSTTITSFFVSLLDFKGIAAFLAPLLEVSYPGLIALTFLSILSKKYRSLKMVIFYGLIACMVIGKI